MTARTTITTAAYLAVGIAFYTSNEQKPCDSAPTPVAPPWWAVMRRPPPPAPCTEPWSVVDALYFCMVSMSTCGRSSNMIPIWDAGHLLLPCSTPTCFPPAAALATVTCHQALRSPASSRSCTSSSASLSSSWTSPLPARASSCRHAPSFSNSSIASTRRPSASLAGSSASAGNRWTSMVAASPISYCRPRRSYSGHRCHGCLPCVVPHHLSLIVGL